jgi:AraC-like DNA-binding protein
MPSAKFPADDRRRHAPVIATNALIPLLQEVEARGVDTREWFADLGVERAAIDDPASRLSYRQASALIHFAAAALPGPLGLAVGRRQSMATMGVLGLAMMTAATVGEAVSVAMRHHQVGGSLMDPTVEPVSVQAVALIAQPRFDDPEILAFLCEELFASSLMMARELAGEGFRPLALELSYAAPAWAGDYRRLFGCPVRFGAAQNRALIDAAVLAQPLPSHHPASARQAEALCRQLEAEQGDRDRLVAQVERLLRAQLAQNPRLPDIARRLNLTERSLRRHLAASGQVFRGIHERVRAERALELLRAGQLSIADIGCAVGFSDAREFRRAFKRWTGMAPRHLRLEATQSS